MPDNGDPPKIDLFASLASPYCYFAIERAAPFVARDAFQVALLPVLPIAIRRPGFYDGAPQQTAPYYDRDVQRTAEFLGLPYAEADPQVIAFVSKTDWRPADDQTRLLRLYASALAAVDLDAGFDFAREAMREIWGGRPPGWQNADRQADVARRAGLDPSQLAQAASETHQTLTARLAEYDRQLTTAGHWGTPCFVHDGEPFFGQDRFDQLLWRLGMTSGR